MPPIPQTPQPKLGYAQAIKNGKAALARAMKARSLSQARTGYETAITEFTAALDIVPGDRTATSNLRQANYGQGDGRWPASPERQESTRRHQRFHRGPQGKARRPGCDDRVEESESAALSIDGSEIHLSAQEPPVRPQFGARIARRGIGVELAEIPEVLELVARGELDIVKIGGT